jgi:outer membrane protein assembly factor BamB
MKTILRTCLILLLTLAPTLCGADLDTADVKGGLVVHIGRGALRAKDGFVVDNLDQCRGGRLPYVDNLVNLLVAESSGNVPEDEVMRVLVPNGVALIGGKKIVKPWPKEMDDWTHYLHDPGNNAVSHDTVVGPPQHLQWVVEPKWARSHDHLATISAVVTAKGRIFYVVDEAPTASVALTPKWFLIARDAFNGIQLWKQPIESWQYHLRGFRAGPAELARRLVAVGDRVYVTLGYGKPVCALDAATGKTLRTYSQTANATEFICHDGVLYVVTSDAMSADAEARLAKAATEKWNFWPVYNVPAPKKNLIAVRADSGETLWNKTGTDVMPTALAAAGNRVFFEDLKSVICADAATGKEIWKVARPLTPKRPSWTAPTLVVCGDVVLSADRAAGDEGEPVWSVNSSGGQAPKGEMIAFNAKTGQRLWSAPAREGYNSPVDLLVTGGVVWSGDLVKASDPGITQGRDLLTGEVRKTRPRDQEFYANGMGHHRCYRNKATDRYLITGRAGAEFVDVNTGKAIANHWTRGACQYGVMPANGLLYVPPHACACFIQSKLNSFNALAPARKIVAVGERLEKGPAFSANSEPQTSEWPTYRGDAVRSGSTSTTVPSTLAQVWKTELGGKLTAPVIAGGRLFVASTETHEVCALDTSSGKELWRFTAGGRVDSPPTVFEGRVLFGSADGWVYCLSANDGRLAWRFRAAPADVRIMAYGQLESPWPVCGSVLVKDGVVFCAAGRSSFLDGGIVLHRLDARTGKQLSQTPVDDRGTTGATGRLNDVLSCDGEMVFMRHESFGLDGQLLKKAKPHLHSAAGFLDGDWWHRTYWIFGTEMKSGWGQWPAMGNRVPSGQIMVMDKDATYGFGREEYANGVHAGMNAPYHLFSCSKQATQPAAATPAAKKRKGKQAAKAEPKAVVRWSVSVPLLARAMVLADKTLFIAGPLEAAYEGLAPSVLWAVSAGDGKKLAECKLSSGPVWDGMASANGRLYVSTLDGRVLCLAERK